MYTKLKKVDRSFLQLGPDVTDGSLLEQERGGGHSHYFSNYNLRAFTATPREAIRILVLLCATSVGALLFVFDMFLLVLNDPTDVLIALRYTGVASTKAFFIALF